MARIVRKIPVQVEVLRTGHDPVIGVCFLSSRGPNGPVQETLLDCLNRTDERMIPFEREFDGAILLVSRSRIEMVRLLSSKDGDLMRPFRSQVAREELVQVRFVGGGEIEGLIQIDMNDTTSRLSDFLNSREVFFPLLTPSGPCLINKGNVLEIRVFENSPLPSFPESVNGR